MEGFLHAHYNGLAPLFSSDDVLMMAEVFLNGLAKDSNNLFFGITHNYGPPYLIKITNAAKFRKFAERIMKMEGNVKEKTRFTRQYKYQFNTDNTNFNEKGFLDMLNDLNAGSGLTLYRAQNNDCKKWIKLERDNFDPTGISETTCN